MDGFANLITTLAGKGSNYATVSNVLKELGSSGSFERSAVRYVTEGLCELEISGFHLSILHLSLSLL